MAGKKNAIVQEILDMLLEGTELLFEWMENPHAQRRRVRGILTHEEWEKIFGDQKRNAALRRLKKKKWINDRQLGNDVVFELSNKAIIEYLKGLIKQEPPRPGTRETLVVFDIPEAARSARTNWRRLLKALGFHKQQLSVWSSMKNIGDQVLALVKALGIEKWVKVYSGTELN
ncbi:hypothetical protein HY630_03725 [Candidatus Uhrbacteria bacterium]|nr:hypothetical protein [Candidatus Uhrbacteria bacterium]